MAIILIYSSKSCAVKKYFS